MHNTLLLLMGVMLAIVVYDSIVFKTPLYYMGFMLGGYVLGGIFRKTVAVQFEEESDSFELTTSTIYVVLTLALIIIRVALGKSLMEELHVAYASDALYLFFIGIYYAKWRMVLKKIDAVIYEFADRKNAEKREKN